MKDGTVPSYLFNFKIHFMKVQIQQTPFSCRVSNFFLSFVNLFTRYRCSTGVVTVW